jgi:hypothetical protein
MASLDPNIWKNIEDQTVTLASTLIKGYANQAWSDSKAFLQRAENDIATWLQDLARGDITQKNFESLVRGEHDLADMTALKQIGLGKVTIDTFVNGFIQVVINAALGAIKIG